MQNTLFWEMLITVSKTCDLCMDYSRADFKLMDILDKDGNINEILTDDM